MHEFHCNMATGDRRGPAACNLVERKYGQVSALLEELAYGQVSALLEELAYGDASTPGIMETKEAWRRTMEAKRVEG